MGEVITVVWGKVITVAWGKAITVAWGKAFTVVGGVWGGGVLSEFVVPHFSVKRVRKLSFADVASG